MLQAFTNYILKHQLATSKQKILLAVSGGIDSMVMLNLFNKSNYQIAIAHCNFQLRGKESDGDLKFVTEKAAALEIPVYYKNFETEKYASENKISIQMAARDLRYAWFEEKRKELDFDLIAIAHNADDVNETFLTNLTRGTGIKGLTGIENKKGNIIRPILFASRKEIVEYAKNNKINFREDSSNASTKYLRNYIRHNLIPAFEKLNPDFKPGLSETIQRIGESEKIFSLEIENRKKQIAIYKNNDLCLPLKELKKLPAIKTYLFEFLRPYNFTDDILNNLLFHLDSQSGKKFLSNTHVMVKDRDYLIITSLKKTNEQFITIDKTTKVLTEPVHLEFEIKVLDSVIKLNKNEHIAQLDMDLLEFPLTLRKWKSGDYFYPLGMSKRKKLSDFFIDEKFSLVQKENTWLVCSGENIVWIIGHRIDDRFKITKNTEKIYSIKFFA